MLHVHRLFPPCTGLSCRDVYEHRVKRCLLISAQVSTARLDTKELTTPDTVPGTADAVQWACELLGCSADELAGREVWDLEDKNLGAKEHQQKLALLIGRGAAAPGLTTLNLSNTQLGAGGAVLLAEGLKLHGSLTSVRAPSARLLRSAIALSHTACASQLNLGNNSLKAAGAEAISEALKINGSLTSLDIRENRIGVEGAKAIGEALKLNGSLTEVRSASAHTRPSDLTAHCVMHS